MYASNAKKRIVGIASLQHLQRGVTSIEYGLLASIIVVAGIAGFTALGGANEQSWGLWVAQVLAALGI